MNKVLFFFACLLSVAAVAAYPSVVVSSSAGTYYAVGETPAVDRGTTQYVTRSSNTLYDYVDGYQAGYGQATQDRAYLPVRTGYRPIVQTTPYQQQFPIIRNDYAYPQMRFGSGLVGTLDPYGKPYAPADTSGYYNRYDITYRGLECDYGRRDICLNRYERCGDYWCQVGDRDLATYSYYNPYNVPGLYTLDDRSGYYYTY